MIDLDEYIPADTATLDIVPASGVGRTGWVVTFAGPAHPKTVAWGAKSARKSLETAQAIAQAQANGKKYKIETVTTDEQRAENVGWVVSRVVDWTPVKIGGVEYSFNEEAAAKLLLNPKMGWALLQMVEFLADERSFTKDSATA